MKREGDPAKVRVAARALWKTLEQLDRAERSGDEAAVFRYANYVAALESVLERAVPSPLKREWVLTEQLLEGVRRNPAVSVAQRRLFGMALSYKRGTLNLSRVPHRVQRDVVRLSRSLTEAKLREFAKTSEAGLPRRK